MIERVFFTSEADDDVAASYDWYESREPGLGEDFLRSVEACISGIQRHPEMYPAAIEEFRRRLVIGMCAAGRVSRVFGDPDRLFDGGRRLAGVQGF